MKLSCPACGAVASLDVLIGHEGARDAVMSALRLPAPLGKALVQYVALFRPASRNLSMDRLSGLLSELHPMIEAAKIERNGRTWSAPQEYWRMALEEMIAKRDKLTLPLKSHGYLLAIIESYSNKADAKEEAQRESQRAGRTPVGAGAAREQESSQARPAPTKAKPRTGMPASVKAALNKQTAVNDGK
ncbi:MAG: hypothetical protein PHD37_17695 [Gallionellaceae bacterium]|nr:hypothetical protein [Gallionellaceae bacterium]